MYTYEYQLYFHNCYKSYKRSKSLPGNSHNLYAGYLCPYYYKEFIFIKLACNVLTTMLRCDFIFSSSPPPPPRRHKTNKYSGVRAFFNSQGKCSSTEKARVSTEKARVSTEKLHVSAEKRCPIRATASCFT